MLNDLPGRKAGQGKFIISLFKSQFACWYSQGQAAYQQRRKLLISIYKT